MSRSSTIINEDWLDLPHAGEILLSEFIEPIDLPVEALANAIHVDSPRLADVISGARPIDAELDLRLGRFFQLSEGYFLRIQSRCDTLIAKRALNGELERILPRAA